MGLLDWLCCCCPCFSTTAIGTDTLINQIFTDPDLPNSEPEYVKRYFDAKLRKQIWNGSTINGGVVTPSQAAENLEDAFQERSDTNGQFPPFTAYHGTKTAKVPELIVKGGFNPAGETLYGGGVYFFDQPDRAEAYAKSGGDGRVLEVRIFSDVAVLDPPALGSDKVTLQTTAVRNILLVKNGLVIFPKRVYAPA